MNTAYIVHIPLLAFILFLIYRNERKTRFGRWLLLGLILKLISSVSLGLIFIHVYDSWGDTFNLFHDGNLIGNKLFSDPGSFFSFVFLDESAPWCEGLIHIDQPRALFFGKLISPVCAISMGNYWITGLYLSLISWFAIKFFLRLIEKYFPSQKMPAFIAFCILPTVVFWSSGIIKETMALSAIVIIASAALVFARKAKMSVLFWVVVVICVYVLAQFKYYYFVASVPLFLSYALIQRYFNEKSFGIRFGTFVILVLSLAFAGSFVHPNLNLNSVLDAIKVNHDITIGLSDPGEFVKFESYDGSFSSMLLCAPKAVLCTLFRPWATELTHFPTILSGLENLLMSILFVLSLVLTILRRSKISFETWVVIIYSLLLATMLCFASPNYGTLVRYKVSFLPFLFTLVMIPIHRFFLEKNRKSAGN